MCSGPPLWLVSDQEGAVISDLISMACEAYDIQKDLMDSEVHTKTGMVEIRLGIFKLDVLKLYAQVQRQHLNITLDECVMEAGMATNSILVYHNAIPNQALFGFEPRDLCSMDNHLLVSQQQAAVIGRVDTIEAHLRCRFHSKEVVLQTVIEHRIAEAVNIKVQQYDTTVLDKLKQDDSVDIWRETSSKDQAHWRGPAEIFNTYRKAGTAVVPWRGNFMLLPLRHARPHVDFVWLLTISFGAFDVEAELVSLVMNVVEDHVLGQVCTYGRFWNACTNEYEFSSLKLHENPPSAYTEMQEISSLVLWLPGYYGVQSGTEVKRTEPFANISEARLVVETKQYLVGYTIESVDLSVRHTLSVPDVDIS